MEQCLYYCALYGLTPFVCDAFLLLLAAVHIVIEHAGDLMLLQGGALGYWSQQGFEGHHKVTKKVYSRASNHRGGRANAETTCSFQIIKHQARKVFCGMRQDLHASFADGTINNRAAARFLRHALRQCPEEKALERKAERITVKRYTEDLCGKAGAGAAKRRRTSIER